ncbi:MAG: hypothetical protein A2W91_00635 [Bacteroidetes bacterium GWF2_38_335]|nr:MAG: hypothetical protein A2W91_00635 [Bacteroidetes bacterium GWF2_38_335]OFY78338.1 MAG: hypothetical protein A2281_04015 [Bacteroidetes bacterium RIFOXYA12_FULL_38_20]HBS87465.1 hypothetical protein [Bacteroidales bacterium]
MNRLVLSILFFVFYLFSGAQTVNGRIVYQEGSLTTVKVWGTHKERGYAYGYLMADKILEVHNKFIKPSFGSHYDAVKKIIIDEVHIKIDKIYHEEALAMVEGMNAKGVDVSDFDYIDILLGNSYLDILGLNRGNFISGCSTLMSWGEATKSSELSGNTIVTRHLDWQPYDPLINNQVLVIHVPSEEDEQPWLSLGFAGHMSVLSGVNENGLCVFQHDLNDPLQGTTKVGVQYEPVWFTMRKAIEKKDYNNDGRNNVKDVKDAIRKNVWGYVDGYIICAIAGNEEPSDSLTAMVAELTPGSPYVTFRSTECEDGLEGDNLYAANGAVARNNKHNYDKRYQDVSKAVGKGEKIGAEKSWKIMKEKSTSTNPNVHFMQIIPETGELKISVYENKIQAFEMEPVTYSIYEFFKKE